MADLSFLDPNMNSTDETPLGAVSPDLSFLDPDQGVKPADPSALINARELTHGMDPQRTAKVIDLSRKAGLPPRIVEERMDEIERREMLNDGLLADVASKAPKTTSFLSDPDRFAVAQTDIENLAELERLIATGPVDSFAMSGQMPVNGDNKLAKELIADPIGAIGKGLIKAPGSLAEMGLNLFSILPGAIDSAAQGIEQLTGLPRGGYFGELRDAALGASKWIRENYLEAEPLQISEDLRGKGAWDNPEIMLDPEWVAYVTTDILPSIGATIAAYMAGGPAAAGVVGGGMEAGGLYQELLDEGMEDWKANTASLVYGVLSGALNAFGADKVLGRGVATSWAKRLIKGFFVKGAAEGATEWAEEPVQALVAGIARGDSVPTIAADIVEATQKGFDVFLPSLITGGIAGTATERVEYQKAQFAAKEQEVLDMLTENVAQSKLAQLDPVLYQEALTVLKEGGKISDIHIPASAIMSDNLAEVSEVLNQLGVSFEAFDLAYNSGDTVAIPVEQYGAAIAANPDLAIRFANDRKLSADGYTRNELAQFNQEWAQEAKRVLQLAAETEELKDQEDAETKAIFEQVYAARQAAGRVPDAARLDAAQFTAALVSMAKMSEGKYTPTQLFEAYMPRVTAGQPIVDQQALQQDAAFAGVENQAEIEEAGRLWAEMGTESPYFKRWFGESKVVDESGKPLVVYHGTTADFEAFQDVNDRQGFYFSENPEYAEAFAEGAGARMLPVYLSLANPADMREGVSSDLYRALSDSGYSRAGDVLSYRPEDYWELFDGDSELKEVLLSLGFDSVKLTEPPLDGKRYTSWLVFDPTQIKSATGNRGTFDLADPRILKQAQFAGATTLEEIREARRLWAEMGTESPYFKRWFGESKVVDESGKPLVVYHGTPDASADMRAKYSWASRIVEERLVPKDKEISDKIIDSIAARIGHPNPDFLKNHPDGIKAITEALGMNEEEKALFDTLSFNLNAIRALRDNKDLLSDDEISYLESEEFQAFDKARGSSNTGAQDAKSGFFFSPDQNFARWFTSQKEMDMVTGEVKEIQGLRPRLFSTYLSMQNPLDLRHMSIKDAQTLIDAGVLNGTVAEIRAETRSVRGSKELQMYLATRTDELRALGYDGIRNWVTFNGKKNEEIIAFNPTQIKSATGNRGTFDLADARIQYQAGPPIDPFDTAGDWVTQELELEEGTATAGEVVQALKARAAELQKLVECLK